MPSKICKGHSYAGRAFGLKAAGCVLTSNGSPYPDITHYRSLVGSLQYLTITRSDISFAVNLLSQFLQAPTKDHYQVVKRILRNVKGTINHGLSFSRGSSCDLVAYSDVDWASCPETHRSTYGYLIFLARNLVS